MNETAGAVQSGLLKRIEALLARAGRGAAASARLLSIMANHVWNDSPAVAVGAGQTVVASVVGMTLTPSGSGKVRITATGVFENAAAAVHTVQLQVGWGVHGLGIVSQYATDKIMLAANGNGGTSIVYEAVLVPGTNYDFGVIAQADAAGNVSCVAHGVQIDVQEIP